MKKILELLMYFYICALKNNSFVSYRISFRRFFREVLPFQISTLLEIINRITLKLEELARKVALLHLTN
jgi:hypothetical protein